MAIPALFAVLALTGMALSTESKQEFTDRNSSSASGQGNDTLPDARPRPDSADRRDQGLDPQPQELPQLDQEDPSLQDPVVEDPADDPGASDREADGGTITVRTEDGELVIELNDDGRPVRVIPGDSALPTDPSRVLTPDGEGRLTGMRITEDGRVEPIREENLQPGDFGIAPLPGGGIEVTRPDGSIIRLTPSPDGDLAAVEVAGNGTGSEVEADDGDITIQPGTELDPDLEIDPASEPIVVVDERGAVRIELEPNGDLVANQPDPGDAIDLSPEDLSAIRIDEDGNIALVPLDEIEADDTVLEPTTNGFDLVRPDGSRVEFRVDGENDGVTATEIGVDGTETELTPNPDGSVTLSDGRTVGPIDAAEDGGTLEQILDRTSDLPWPWVFGAIAALAALSIGTAVYLHRNRPDDPFDYSQFAAGGVAADQFEDFLAVLAAQSDATRAIRLAFYASERGLAGLPPRRADETPFEWHARVETMRPDLARPLAPICDMFARVRFAPVNPSTADRDLMIMHLEELNDVASRSADKRSAADHDLAGAR